MAALLVDSYADDFHPEQHSDSYREELQQMIDAKLEGEQAFPEVSAADGEDAEVLDLLAALQRSVQRNQAKQESADSDGEAADKPAVERPKRTRTKKTGAVAQEEKPKAQPRTRSNLAKASKTA